MDIDDLLLNTNERDNSNEVIQTKELLTKENRIKELEDHIKKLNQCIDLLNDKIGYYSKSK